MNKRAQKYLSLFLVYVLLMHHPCAHVSVEFNVQEIDTKDRWQWRRLADQCTISDGGGGRKKRNRISVLRPVSPRLTEE